MQIIIFLSVLLVFASVRLVFASSTATFNQNEVSASVSWSATYYYPGEYGQANITLISNCSQNIQINMIGIHFDWNTANTYFFNDFNTSINLPSDSNYTFNPVIFYVPPQESISSHTYYIHFEGTEEGQSPQNITWSSQTFTMPVYTQDEAAYNQLLPQVMNKITEAQKANYQSPDAKSLLQNATETYNQATSLANQSQWQAATSDLQNALSLLDNASAKEQTFVAQQTLLEETIVSISVIIIISVIVFTIVLKKRKKASQQSFEATNPHSRL
jgi:hypothetical protein